MSPSILFIIATLIVLLTSGGQILLKTGSNADAHILFNRFVFAGYFCFICVIFLSAVLMKHLEFKYFSVIISINYLGATVMAILLLKEKFTMKKLLGCTMISVGAVIFAL